MQKAAGIGNQPRIKAGGFLGGDIGFDVFKKLGNDFRRAGSLRVYIIYGAVIFPGDMVVYIDYGF